jgi:hypothetical protein
MSDASHKIAAGHLQRAAFVYIRQSSCGARQGRTGGADQPRRPDVSAIRVN